MRRGRDSEILKNESGEIIGINLGADFCAEHEWGIGRLKKMFGVLGEGYGVDKRKITVAPSCTHFIDDGNSTVLAVCDYVDRFDPKQSEIARSDYNGDPLLTAWDERSLGVNASAEEDRKALREVYEALLRKDLAIWLGGGGVFKNAGLVLAIVSRIPERLLNTLREADLDRERLQKAAEATGIKKLLEDAGRRYFALSPRWAKDISCCSKTDHPVVFWLNPYEQDIHNYGWFTVEDLKLWIENRGPCMGGRKTKQA